jgi:hypothetical protein
LVSNSENVRIKASADSEFSWKVQAELGGVLELDVQAVEKLI